MARLVGILALAVAALGAGCAFDQGGFGAGQGDAAGFDEPDGASPAADAATPAADSGPVDAAVGTDAWLAADATVLPDGAVPPDAAVVSDAAPPIDAVPICLPDDIACDLDECEGQSCGSGCVCSGGLETETSCTDGADNDADGARDCRDADCPGCGPLSGCCPNGTCRLLSLGC